MNSGVFEINTNSFSFDCRVSFFNSFVRQFNICRIIGIHACLNSQLKFQATLRELSENVKSADFFLIDFKIRDGQLYYIITFRFKILIIDEANLGSFIHLIRQFKSSKVRFLGDSQTTINREIENLASYKNMNPSHFHLTVDALKHGIYHLQILNPQCVAKDQINVWNLIKDSLFGFIFFQSQINTNKIQRHKVVPQIEPHFSQFEHFLNFNRHLGIYIDLQTLTFCRNKTFLNPDKFAKSKSLHESYPSHPPYLLYYLGLFNTDDQLLFTHFYGTSDFDVKSSHFPALFVIVQILVAVEDLQKRGIFIETDLDWSNILVDQEGNCVFNRIENYIQIDASQGPEQFCNLNIKGYGQFREFVNKLITMLDDKKTFETDILVKLLEICKREINPTILFMPQIKFWFTQYLNELISTTIFDFPFPISSNDNFYNTSNPAAFCQEQIKIQNARLYELLGNLYQENEFSKFAIPCYKRSYSFHNNSDLLHQIGLIYEQLEGNNEKAIKYFRKAACQGCQSSQHKLHLYPNDQASKPSQNGTNDICENEIALYTQALEYEQKGNFKEAFANYHQLYLNSSELYAAALFLYAQPNISSILDKQEIEHMNGMVSLLKQIDRPSPFQLNHLISYLYCTQNKVQEELSDDQGFLLLQFNLGLLNQQKGKPDALVYYLKAFNNQNSSLQYNGTDIQVIDHQLATFISFYSCLQLFINSDDEKAIQQYWSNLNQYFTFLITDGDRLEITFKPELAQFRERLNLEPHFSYEPPNQLDIQSKLSPFFRHQYNNLNIDEQLKVEKMKKKVMEINAFLRIHSNRINIQQSKTLGQLSEYILYPRQSAQSPLPHSKSCDSFPFDNNVANTQKDQTNKIKRQTSINSNNNSFSQKTSAPTQQSHSFLSNLETKPPEMSKNNESTESGDSTTDINASPLQFRNAMISLMEQLFRAIMNHRSYIFFGRLPPTKEIDSSKVQKQ